MDTGMSQSHSFPVHIVTIHNIPNNKQLDRPSCTSFLRVFVWRYMTLSYIYVVTSVAVREFHCTEGPRVVHVRKHHSRGTICFKINTPVSLIVVSSSIHSTPVNVVYTVQTTDTIQTIRYPAYTLVVHTVALRPCDGWQAAESKPQPDTFFFLDGNVIQEIQYLMFHKCWAFLDYIWDDYYVNEKFCETPIVVYCLFASVSKDVTPNQAKIFATAFPILMTIDISFANANVLRKKMHCV